jgi:hypothetical protein
MYKINFSNGDSSAFYADYDTAIEAILEIYGNDVEIGHDGDLSDGGDRTLIWDNEEDSLNDSGYKAVASITKA